MKGRVVLVSGAASGIGAAVCRAAAAAGARPVLLDVAEARGQALAAELGGVFIRCDVADRRSWSAAIAECLERVGPPDFAHLNAGVMTVPADAPFSPLESVSEEAVRRIIGINLEGVIFGFQALLPHMAERDSAICVTASLAGLIPLPLDPLYAATKHALVGLVRSLAAARADTPLRINAICPGAVDTAIVPVAMRESGMALMPSDLLARDVVDLLMAGQNGEIRLRRDATAPAESVPVADFG